MMNERKKTCTRCCTSRRIRHFSIAVENQDGYKNYCKPCVAELHMLRRKNIDTDSRDKFIDSAIALDILKRPSIARQMGL